MIREALNTDECIDPECNFEKIFLGDQFGVILTKRGVNDNHICFNIISEDDENWSISDNSSSFWLPDCLEVLHYVEKWLEENAEKGEWGYSFK